MPASDRALSSLPPAGDVERFLAVDFDLDVSAGNEHRLGSQNDQYQRKHQQRKHAHAKKNRHSAHGYVFVGSVLVEFFARGLRG